MEAPPPPSPQSHPATTQPVPAIWWISYRSIRWLMLCSATVVSSTLCLCILFGWRDEVLFLEPATTLETTLGPLFVLSTTLLLFTAPCFFGFRPARGLSIVSFLLSLGGIFWMMMIRD